MKDWVCAGAALAGVALLELQGLTAPVASDAVAALQPVFVDRPFVDQKLSEEHLRHHYAVSSEALGGKFSPVVIKGRMQFANRSKVV